MANQNIPAYQWHYCISTKAPGLAPTGREGGEKGKGEHPGLGQVTLESIQPIAYNFAES